MNKDLSILIYGFGNPGRMDDGLGYETVKMLEEWTAKNGMSNISFDCNYQLNIEDAYEISKKDIVIFVDASKEEIDDFAFTTVNRNSKMSFTSHEASPGYIYYLCESLFNKSPKTYLLHIKGFKWDFKQGISKIAKENLYKAVSYLKIILQNPDKINRLKHNIFLKH
ncbi:MAG TPA: hydrogenase maturation protease [Bacteroidetes bacterium]|nr:hydrogenase maturation protease [Bacteroidota bacterium]